MKKSIVLFALTLLPLCAQEIKFPASFDRLAGKASETVNVNLDGSTLQMAGNFLSSNKGAEAKVKDLAKNLKGIYIRTFEFASEGAYSDADVAPLRLQLTSAAGWSKTVDVMDKTDHVEIYTKKDADRVVGMALIAAEKKELAVIWVDGPINLGDLTGLAGLDLGVGATKSGRKPAKKD
jgi:hypothetical protein